MAICSTPFGRTTLSGEDAKQFMKQIENSKPSEKMSKAVERALLMRQKMEKLGVKI
jgi:hypothetical protein